MYHYTLNFKKNNVFIFLKDKFNVKIRANIKIQSNLMFVFVYLQKLKVNKNV
jgi:hypothetical protein